MPKGNSKAYLNVKNNLIDDSGLTVSPEDNRNYIQLIQESFHVNKPDLSNQNEIDNAIKEYFERCYKHNVRPGNMGVYNALGLTRQEVNEIIGGRRKANSYLIDTLKKVKSSLAEYRELLGSEGKLNPATLIFWQKNHDSFEDVQRVDVSAVNQVQAEKSPEELAQSVIDDIPSD